MQEDRLQPRWNEHGLAPAVVQDARTGQVLMLAWMNAEAWQLTQETGQAHFWSRSRQSLWHKGETSGNVQHVVEIRLDCDQDAILLRVEPAGPACHTGERSCFFQVVAGQWTVDSKDQSFSFGSTLPGHSGSEAESSAWFIHRTVVRTRHGRDCQEGGRGIRRVDCGRAGPIRRAAGF